MTAAKPLRAAATAEEVFGAQHGLFSRAYTRDEDPLSEERLKELFGPQAAMEGPLAPTGIGCRFHGVDVAQRLGAAQAAYLVDALSMHSIVVFAGQDLRRVSLAHFERFANHFGAPQPVPKVVTEGVVDAVNEALTQIAGPEGERLEHLPIPPESSALYTVTNVEPVKEGSVRVLTPRPRARNPSRQDISDRVRCEVLWHTDQDHERIACNTTMFLVHKHPAARDSASGNWLGSYPEVDYDTFYRHPDPPEGMEHFHTTDARLVRLRQQHLPLNAETAFADTVAAFEALPATERERLDKIRMVKYERPGDDVDGKGYYCPLIRTNPRSGRRMIYSPVYGSRFVLQNIPPPQIEGMSKAETKAFLDELEAHCLQPRFRYNHLHQEGDLVIWDDYALLHCLPPVKIGITHLEDARLYYRIATKGAPRLTLPRQDTREWLLENLKDTYSTPAEILEVGSA